MTKTGRSSARAVFDVIKWPTLSVFILLAGGVPITAFLPPTAAIAFTVIWLFGNALLLVRRQVGPIWRNRREISETSGADVVTTLVLTVSTFFNVASPNEETIDYPLSGSIAAAIVLFLAVGLVCLRPNALAGLTLDAATKRRMSARRLRYYNAYVAYLTPLLRDRSAVMALFAAALTLPDVAVISALPDWAFPTFLPALVAILAVWDSSQRRSRERRAPRLAMPRIYVQQGIMTSRRKVSWRPVALAWVVFLYHCIPRRTDKASPTMTPRSK